MVSKILTALVLFVGAYLFYMIAVGNGKDADFIGSQVLWGNSLRMAQYMAYVVAFVCILGAVTAFIEKPILGKAVAASVALFVVILFVLQPSQYVPFLDIDRKYIVVASGIVPLIGALLLFLLHQYSISGKGGQGQ